MQQLRGMPTEMLDKTCNLDRIEDQGVNMDDHMAVATSQSRGPRTKSPGASRWPEYESGPLPQGLPGTRWPAARRPDNQASYHRENQTITRWWAAMVQRVTKQQAMVSMGVSSSTLERRIKSGEVQVEVDHAGSRRRVWVVVDDDPADEPPGIQHDIQHPTGDTQVVVMQVKLDNALALAEYRAELLRESETRFHELLQQMNSLTRALPAPAEKPRRSWWPWSKNAGH